MADRLSAVHRRAGSGLPRPIVARACACMLAFVALLGVSPLRAETLPDPTRPAAGFGGEAPVMAGAADAAGGPLLQSVIVPRRGKPKAVIGGELVVLGEKYGEQTLIKVGEREVVLEGPRGREVLKLTPGIEKQAVKRSPKRPPAGESKP